MTQYLTKSTNQTALELSNFYPTFEQCLNAVSNIKYQKDLRIKSDPISSQHILVESYSRGTLQDKFKIEKNAIEHANKTVWPYIILLLLHSIILKLLNIHTAF